MLQCKKCGYNECLRALHRHHIIDEKGRRLVDTIILCANCHAEEHYRLRHVYPVDKSDFKSTNETFEEIRRGDDELIMMVYTKNGIEAFRGMMGKVIHGKFGQGIERPKAFMKRMILEGKMDDGGFCVVE